MNFLKYLTPPIFLLIALLITHTNGATIDIQNNCDYTIWPAAVPGGGQRLDPGQLWVINASSGGLQVWARTVCNFDQSGQNSTCQTGDCDGLLQCQTHGNPPYGNPPNTLVEFALNQFNNMDLFDISLVNGFNVPVELSPTSGSCTRVTSCTADINGKCPSELRAPGGCNNPCTVFKTDEYCCSSGSCEPNKYSQFFNNSCPDAYYGYSSDAPQSTLTCPSGTNYKIVFCPK